MTATVEYAAEAFHTRKLFHLRHIDVGFEADRALGILPHLDACTRIAGCGECRQILGCLYATCKCRKRTAAEQEQNKQSFHNVLRFQFSNYHETVVE